MADIVPYTPPVTLPCGKRASFRLTSRLTLVLGGAALAAPAVALQAAADYLRSIAVISNIRATVLISPPLRQGSGYAYIVSLVFPIAVEVQRTVDGLPCENAPVTGLYLPQVVSQCGTIAASLNAQLQTGEAANTELLTLMSGAAAPLDVQEATFSPFVCRT